MFQIHRRTKVDVLFDKIIVKANRFDTYRQLEQEFRKIFVQDCAYISELNVSTRSNIVFERQKSIRITLIRVLEVHLNK